MHSLNLQFSCLLKLRIFFSLSSLQNTLYQRDYLAGAKVMKRFMQVTIISAHALGLTLNGTQKATSLNVQFVSSDQD